MLQGPAGSSSSWNHGSGRSPATHVASQVGPECWVTGSSGLQPSIEGQRSPPSLFELKSKSFTNSITFHPTFATCIHSQRSTKCALYPTQWLP